MRVDVDFRAATPVAEHSEVRALRSRRGLVASILFAVILIAAGAWAAPRALEALRGWTVAHGHGALREDIRLVQRLHLVPGRILRDAAVPWLAIDVGFMEMEKLRAQRAVALERGILFHGEDDFVPASIRHEGGTTRVKLRLKGDWTDHLEGDRWSFRIHVRDGEQILGMRRFSVQHPMTRGYQGEVLYLETLRRLGVMVPRYSFVEVSLNGRDLGLMALEEHFAKELMEANGRVESVILKFDETHLWTSVDRYAGWRGAFDTHVNATVEPFESVRVEEDPALSSFSAAGAGLLRGFATGRLSASSVFDPARLGAFLATAELWGSWHSRKWNNQRFYYNPLIGRLEPVPFDGNLQERHPVSKPNKVEQPIVAQMLRDPLVWEEYTAALEKLAGQVEDGTLIEDLSRIESGQLAVLQKEFWFLEGFPMEELRERAAKIRRSLADGTLRPDYVPPLDYPILVNAYLIEENGSWLELASAVPHEVVVESARWVEADGSSHPFVPSGEPSLPVTLAATPIEQAPQTVRIPITIPEGPPPRLQQTGSLPATTPGTGSPPSGSPGTATQEAPSPLPTLVVVARIRGEKRSYEQQATRNYAEISTPVVAISSVEEQLAALPFLSRGADGSLSVAPGRWRVTRDLVVPRGSRLTVPAGTTLSFGEDVVLLSYGPVDLNGEMGSPVVLEADGPEGATWPGVVVIEAGAPSRWTHASIRSTRGVARGGWRLTGGVTFIRSDTDMSQCAFEGNRGEDALNVVHSHLEGDGLVFSGTTSDALDSDFSTGNLTDVRFESIGTGPGGDGLDVSGSTFTVTGGRFKGISDKAFSAGERSHLTIRDAVVEDAGVGVASKDDSQVEITGSVMRRISHAALMAYVKKPEYGAGGTTIARDVTIEEALPALAQTGSRIEIDGREVETKDLDVDRLYETVMKPALPK